MNKPKVTALLQQEYMIGTLGQIKKRDFDGQEAYNLDTAKEKFLEYDSGSSIVIVPHLIGAYRKVKITFNADAEGEPIDKYTPRGPKPGFDVHPDLVQIGYDPEVIDRSAVCDFIGSESHRMIIVPCMELAPVGDDFKQLANLNGQRVINQMNGIDANEREEELAIELFEKVLKTDGLGKLEYDMLLAHR